MGAIDQFNGVQVEQTNSIIKLHNKQYIEKIIAKHGWDNDQFKTKDRIVPMRSESSYLHEIEMEKGPTEEKEKKKLELDMKFNYRQALGEVLYVMVTCRSDVSIAVTKLSQYSNNPAEIHYKALTSIFRYLRSKKEDGLYFWRKEKTVFRELQYKQNPICYSDEKEIEKVSNHMQQNTKCVKILYMVL